MEEEKLKRKKRIALAKGNKQQLVLVCEELAQLYLKEGNHELSKNEFKNVAELFKELNNPIEYARANQMIGDNCMALEEFDEALKHQQIQFDIAKEQKDDMIKQRAYVCFGRTYLTKAITNIARNPETLDTESLKLAHSSFMQSLKICDELQNVEKEELMEMRARAYLNLALVKENLGDLESAENFIVKSIHICKKHHLYSQLHQGYITLGQLYDKKGDYKKAIAYFNLALDVASSLSDKIILLCSTYSAKADVLISIGEYSSAKHILIKAYKLKHPIITERSTIEHKLKVLFVICQTEDALIITPVTDHKKRKELFEKMGDGSVVLKLFDKAIEYYLKALECALACGESGYDLNPIYVSLAQTYRDNKQYKMAYEYFQKDYATCLDNPEACFRTLLNLASICELCKMPYEDVAGYFDRARQEARKTKDKKDEAKVINTFIRYQKKMAKDKEAAEMQKEFDMLDYELTDSDSEGEDDGCIPEVGEDIDLDEWIDHSDVSDEEETQIRQTRKRGRKFSVKKNCKGETQLHTACIQGNMALVMSLLDHKHPVNVRDYSGWLPIHEACNHGYVDIVRLLISKDAAINDPGGKACKGMTPLHDACSNGHLEVVELLLEKGASPIALTHGGKTPLDYLKVWREDQDLDPIMQTFYETLVAKMTTALEMVGRSTTQTISNTPADSDALYFEKPTGTPARSPRGTPAKSPRVSPKKASPYRPVGSLRYSVDVGDDLDNPSGSSLRRHSSSKESSRYNDSNDDSDSSTAACSEYRRAMASVRHRLQDLEPQKSPKKKSSSAFLSEEEVGDDWLDDDLINQPKRQKRSSNTKQNFLESRGIRRTNSNSDSPIVIDVTSDNEQENEAPNNCGYESSDSFKSTSSNKRKRSQSSLLESGFSKNRSDSAFSSSVTPVNCVAKTTNKPYKRQQKLNTFVNLDVSQHDSEPNPISQAIPNPIIPILAVNVRVENKLWRIPVPANEINELPIEWLAKEASKRYYKQEGISPTLQLMTKEGALLLNEDPLRMIFSTTAQADEIHSSIVNWNLPPLPERYLEVCNNFRIAPCSRVRKCFDESQGTLNLKLANLSLKKDQLPPLFRALNRQNNLLHLDVSNIKLLNEGVQELCFALPSLVQLRSLNLSRNNLTGEGIRSLSEIFINAEQPILTNLTDLNLSYNLFGDDTLRHLAAIFQKLKLRILNLSGCSLPKNIFDSVFNQGLLLNLKHLEICDVSYNDLSVEDIIKFLSYLNFTIISNLNLSLNSNVSNSGITKAIADKLSQQQSNNIKNLNLAHCQVNDSEIWDLLRALKYSQERDELCLAYNCDLTGVSLRRLLQHRPSFSSLNLLGCTNILQYFDISTFTNSPVNGVIHINTLKKFKISINCKKNSNEADFLMRMWEKEWGKRARTKKLHERSLHFSVED